MLGERRAARHLRRAGYRILARNYRCPLGEIDLICRDQAALVFVEVKTRSKVSTPDPAQIPARTQWRRIENAARYFLKSCVRVQRPCRFDVITVEWSPDGPPRIEHAENAYQPGFR